MTVPLHFYDTAQSPAASSASWPLPAKAQGLRRVVLRLAHGARANSRSVRDDGNQRPRLGRPVAAACGRGAATGGAGADVSNRNRLQFTHRLSVVLGHPEFLLDRLAAAPRAVGCVVADLGGGAGAAVAAQARRGADDRELRRSDGDRSRYRGVFIHDLSAFALVRDCGCRRHDPPDVCAVVARSVPHPPLAGDGLRAGVSGRFGRLCLRLAG